MPTRLLNNVKSCANPIAEGEYSNVSSTTGSARLLATNLVCEIVPDVSLGSDAVRGTMVGAVRCPAPDRQHLHIGDDQVAEPTISNSISCAAPSHRLSRAPSMYIE